MRRSVWFCCLCTCLLLLGLVVVAQVTQEKKALETQSTTQSRLTDRKMVQSEQLTQQMTQNRYSFQKKSQVKASTHKMTKSGSNGDGNHGSYDSHDTQPRGQRRGDG